MSWEYKTIIIYVETPQFVCEYPLFLSAYSDSSAGIIHRSFFEATEIFPGAFSGCQMHKGCDQGKRKFLLLPNREYEGEKMHGIGNH